MKFFVGFVLAFACLCAAETFRDSRDGHVYKTVKISDQVWMAEYLNIETSEGSWCHDDNPKNCEKYGRLYTWDEAKEMCPEGWHLPNEDEWHTLVTAVGGTSIAGMKLKSTSGWNGEDSYGFTILPAGYRMYGGSFMDVGKFAEFWTSRERGIDSAIKLTFMYLTDGVVDSAPGKHEGLSVRCLKDSSSDED